MSCSSFSSLAINRRSSAYFTVWMICPPILKNPNPSKASLVRYSLYKLNRIGDNQHPCLTPLPIFTLLVSSRFSRTLTHWALYKLLISLLSRHSIPVYFRICINLVQLTRSNAFWQSMKQTLSSSSISKVHSDIILCIPSSFSSSKSKLMFSEYILNFLFNPSSKYLCYSLRCMCDKADCAMVAAFCSLWLFL